jgi:hypothetical protein
MMFKRGTPQSVIKAAEEAQKNKPKVDNINEGKKQPSPTDGKKPVFRDVMPVIGGGPKISVEEKAAHEKKLAEKIKANTPQPTQPAAPRPTTPTPRPTTPTPRPTTPTPRPTTPTPKTPPPPVKTKPPTHTGNIKSLPKTPPAPIKPTSLVGMPKTSRPEMPQANTVPNAQMAAMQKMPQPNTAPPSNMSVVPNLKGTGFSVGPNGMPQLGGSSNMMSSSPAGGVPAMKRGGSVRSKPAAKFSSSGSTSKISSRGDGIAQRGKTKGRYI